MTLTLSEATRNALVDVLGGRPDLGTGAGILRIYGGARPAGPGTATTETVLAEVTLADPAFGAPATGVKNLTDPAAVTAAATGTATWFRILDSGGVAHFDGKVTATGGGGDLTLSTTSLTSGLSVDITGGTITQPAGTAD